MARIRGAATVVTAHNVIPHRRHPLDVLITRAVLGVADKVVLHSPRNAGEALRTIRLPPERIAVIPHGSLYGGVAAAESDGRGQGAKDLARGSLGLPPEAVVLLFFGGIREHKGLDVLVSSLSRIVASTYDVILVVAGQDWGEWGRVEKIISDLDLASHVRPYIRYISEEEMGRLFVAADAVVLPYLTLESQSGVGMAALSFGKPLVVTDTGGLPELVLDRSCVAEPGSSESLLRCLLPVVDSPSRRRKLAGQARLVAGTHSWIRISERTIRLYKSISAERGNGTAARRHRLR